MSNYCAAKIKTKEFEDVIEMGQRILSIDKNGKAMFRLAQAYFALEDFDNAEEYAINACSFFPEDNEIKKLRDNIKSKIQEKTKESQEESKPAENEQKEPSEPVKEEKKEEPKPEVKPTEPIVLTQPIVIEQPKEEKIEQPSEKINTENVSKPQKVENTQKNNTQEDPFAPQGESDHELSEESVECPKKNTTNQDDCKPTIPKETKPEYHPTDKPDETTPLNNIDEVTYS
jgi:tetratricopeptide (TPR) repeat protein